MITFKILNSQVTYDGEVIEIKENIPNSESFMEIYGGGINKLSLETPHYKIVGKNIYLPSKEINLADVKSFIYSAIRNIIREDKQPIISLSGEGPIYDFSVDCHEVKITEKTLNGIHFLSAALQKPLVASPINVQLPPWVAPFNLSSAVISIDEKPQDVLKKHFSQISKIVTDSGYIEKNGSRLTKIYHVWTNKELCYTQLTGYVCFEDSGSVKEIRPSDKEVEKIVNDILKGYAKCTVERGMIVT
ncbi:hypothetical protein [Acidianus sp. HS-5]|uniref:hypothetical protein n=1 Tax=Acidianus sp. HS-5 TaxID=2886040 RepID=UPI001F25E4B7|nr:hypothetical protein [Acidianus sp. HS-5]BDC17861.1 hypothetical protein HS5_07510 [Acidianus sp. HS-5]